MAEIIFFEKTGCINNTKQKRLLTLAGHDVEAVDLVRHPWTKAELLSFFDELEVDEWFNQNAPAITSGNLNPGSFDRESAPEALLQDHLLIRRPLMIIGDEKIVGFNKQKVDQLIGLSRTVIPEIQGLLRENLEDCPQKSMGSSCD